jgi:hypothetical protein
MYNITIYKYFSDVGREVGTGTEFCSTVNFEISNSVTED